MTNLPYLTPDLPGIGGLIKQRSEDFFVQEIPAYEPSGEGEHVYCEIQKQDLTTFDAVNRIARALNVSTHDIGFAGMKDARAVTRQVLSIAGTTPEAVMAVSVPGIAVQWAIRHTNKLRLGHLSGNRFAIKIRNVEPTHVIRAQAVIRYVADRGMPNYFGEQRFGRRGNNDLLGAALLSNDNQRVLQLLLGDPRSGLDSGEVLRAREAFAARENEASLKLWPRNAGMERRALVRLINTGKPSAAVGVVDEKIRRLWISALQSRLFNEVLSRRINSIGTLLEGDLAQKHDSGGVFLVESAVDEQHRADACQISPTGPLIGYRMTEPAGAAAEIEQKVMEQFGLTREVFRQPGKHRVKGARRPLRVFPTDVHLEGGVDDHGPHVTIAFTLPPGSFATVLLREVMKSTEPPAE